MGSAHEQYLDNVVPNSGWDLEEGEYRIIWFDGDQMPNTLLRHIEIGEPFSSVDTTIADESDEIEDDEDHVPLATEMESSSDEDCDEYID